MEMFCRQCEQTAKGQGCSVQGVCGKTPETADLQDLLIYSLLGIAVYGNKARELKVIDEAVDRFVIEALFTTVTNVNFDSLKIKTLIEKSAKIKEQIRTKFLKEYKTKNGRDFSDKLPEVVNFTPKSTESEMLQQALDLAGRKVYSKNEDIRSLQEIILYGLKGVAAYADHAFVLGQKSEEVMSFFHKALAAIIDSDMTLEKYIALVLETGKVNLKCMEILDKANTDTYGHPEPTQVSVGVYKGPAVIVSGHDLKDIYELLTQAEPKGVNIYTHGEMLPAHAYPELKKFANFKGHFGTAWQNQQKEFDNIPAAVLFTTNCIQKPKPSYEDRVFTTGLVAWPGAKNIETVNGKKDFSPVISKALELGGFKDDDIMTKITVGFARNAVLSVADKVVDLVKRGKIKRFFLVGGCDGAKPGRNYYTDLAKSIPEDCIILTLACGKFRFNYMDFGTIEGIPRLLDIGQCNDSYSAIQIAVALAGVFKCGVNDLPLSIILSWYEQKAVCVLLTLLSLGIKNIKIGPSLPAFITPNVLKVLVDNFNIQPISTVDADIKLALAGK
ncbi:MAG: hypothetical protein ACD_79C00231G0001 [uncultured bacterium]|nr:MAG: hypothetical protein ACD_79C00231G0001 [uncultured bacterium]